MIQVYHLFPFEFLETMMTINSNLIKMKNKRNTKTYLSSINSSIPSESLIIFGQSCFYLTQQSEGIQT